MNLTANVYDNLAIVTLTGYESDDVQDGPADPKGSANWFYYQYERSEPDDDGVFDPKSKGIIQTDWDGPPEEFSFLVNEVELEAVKELAEEHGYHVVRGELVTEPICFGDSAGTVVVLKHPDGWIVAENS